jgi:hypothetical protein
VVTYELDDKNKEVHLSKYAKAVAHNAVKGGIVKGNTKAL